MARTCWDCGRDDTYLDPDAVAGLRAQLAAAEAERDRYLTRACVAEAKVAKVREIEDEMMCETPAGKTAVDMAWCKLLHTYAANILTAIGGNP